MEPVLGSTTGGVSVGAGSGCSATGGGDCITGIDAVGVVPRAARERVVFSGRGRISGCVSCGMVGVRCTSGSATIGGAAEGKEGRTSALAVFGATARACCSREEITRVPTTPPTVAKSTTASVALPARAPAPAAPAAAATGTIWGPCTGPVGPSCDPSGPGGVNVTSRWAERPAQISSASLREGLTKGGFCKSARVSASAPPLGSRQRLGSFMSVAPCLPCLPHMLANASLKFRPTAASPWPPKRPRGPAAVVKRPS